MKFKLLLIAFILMSIDTQGCFAMEELNINMEELNINLTHDVVVENIHQFTPQLLRVNNNPNRVENAFMCFIELNMRNPDSWWINMRRACSICNVKLSILHKHVAKYKKKISPPSDIWVHSHSIGISVLNLPHNADCGYSALIQSSNNTLLYNSKITLLDTLLTKLNDENAIARKLIAQEIMFYITTSTTETNKIIKDHFWDNLAIFDEIMRTVNDDYLNALFEAEAPGVAESYITLLKNSQIPMTLPHQIENDSFTGICDAIAHSCFKTNLVIVDGHSENILHQYLAEFPKTTYIISISDPETGLQHFQTGYIY